MSEMIYDLALVQDRGSHWFVTNLTQNTLDNQALKDEKILRLSYMSHELIKRALFDGKKVHVYKDLRTEEVLPGDFVILENNSDTIQDYRDSAIRKIRMLVTPNLSKISGFALYGFMILNNELANSGYFITDSNREEKYLQILETGDEQLISKLEDYLNYRDEIQNVFSLERKFTKFRNDIKDCLTIEEVEKTQNAFLEEFYKNY